MITGLEIKFSDDVIKVACDNIRKVLESGKLVYDNFVPLFEDHLKRLAGTSSAATFASDTSAQACLYQALGLNDGIIAFQGNAFPTPAFEAIRAGMEVAWLDINPKTLDIELDCLEKLARHTNLRALSVMSTGGRLPGNIDAIMHLSKQYGFVVIDDAAHAFGSYRNKLDGQYLAGGWAHFGIFSFYATKPLTSGEGGAIVSNRDADVQTSAQYGRYGKETFFGPTECKVPGFSCRYGEIQAAICVALLDTGHVHRAIERRRVIAKKYIHALHNLYKISLYDYGDSSFYKFPIYVNNESAKIEFKKFLGILGIGLSAGVYELPAYSQPGFSDRYRQKLYGTESFCTHHVCLPMHENLSDKDVEQVIAATQEFFRD